LELLHNFQILLLIQKYVHHRSKLPAVFSVCFEDNKLLHCHEQKNDFHTYAMQSVCVCQPAELIDQLDTNEFYELEPPVKLQILVGLCHRIMASYSVQDYMDEKSNEACKLWLVLSHVWLKLCCTVHSGVVIILDAFIVILGSFWFRLV